MAGSTPVAEGLAGHHHAASDLAVVTQRRANPRTRGQKPWRRRSGQTGHRLQLRRWVRRDLSRVSGFRSHGGLVPGLILHRVEFNGSDPSYISSFIRACRPGGVDGRFVGLIYVVRHRRGGGENGPAGYGCFLVPRIENEPTTTVMEGVKKGGSSREGKKRHPPPPSRDTRGKIYATNPRRKVGS